ncbi:MAG TPA: hypothetical protein VEA81_02115 [Burkholderiaceae bacterium]|nr:hypothetical protein [Burkholderiaceae bacterium]
MTDAEPTADLPEDPQTTLGETLWLMSRWDQAPCPALARGIAERLAALAGHPDCGEPLRRRCRILRAHWAARALHAELALAASTGDDAPRGTTAAGPAEAAAGAPSGATLH